MLTAYSHLFFLVSFLSLFIVFLFALLFCLASSQAFFVSFNLFYVSSGELSLSFFFDLFSLVFCLVVLMISSIVMFYSLNYLAPYSKSKYFLVLTALFVCSMLLVLTMSNLFFIMLGWDGLGVVSFFLIVYFQNQTSITSGLFTLYMNRVGDCFFLVSLCTFFLTQSQKGFSFTPSDVPFSLSLLLCLTFMTKSALFPFSPWLPLAMAAPTPISALVHSSTLVTAGLYLMIRYSYFIFHSAHLLQLLVLLSVFTSFYAGLNTMFETDLKKLIALSTLSHLGFISLSLSSGLIELGFFHMTVHALFKSLLFMAMGDTMMSFSHSQDIRHLSAGTIFVPSSSCFMLVSLANLLGLPAMSGFYSKDLVLETLNLSAPASFLSCIVFINVFFTFFYSFQLLFFMFNPVKVFPLVFKLPPSQPLLHTALLCCLSVASLLFGWVATLFIHTSIQGVSLPLPLKLAPLSLLLLLLTSLLVSGSQGTSLKQSHWSYFSSMMNLLPVTKTLSASSYISLMLPALKSSELGSFNFSLNKYPLAVVLLSSSLLVKVSRVSPLFSSVAMLGLILGLVCCS